MRGLAATIALLGTCVWGVRATTPATTEQSRQVEKYATDMMNNDKIREVYVKCLLDKGPCNEDAADLKSW